MVCRVFVEKREPYNHEAAELLADLRGFAGLQSVTAVRVFYRYDVEGICPQAFERAVATVLSDPLLDSVTEDLPELSGARLLGLRLVPGQFDQRVDAAAQSIALLTMDARPSVAFAKIYAFFGAMSDTEYATAKAFLQNPIECVEVGMDKPATLAVPPAQPAPEQVVEGFCAADDAQLGALLSTLSLAMDADDLRCVRDYFAREGRDPSLTELRLLDTYWSDHCRHTTFNTALTVEGELPQPVREAYERYLTLRAPLRKDKPVTLMDLATIYARLRKHAGEMTQVDESDEVNACCVKIKADFPEGKRDYLFYFKNETHNHPTEIEPFGGAATCLGGGIRDPLSGRSTVYQAMRITGAGDPHTPYGQTLRGKLPQRTITKSALAGYSSYGNQVGVAAGYLDEIYHPGYVAKRMECGAAVAAAPADHVVRLQPEPGDVVFLVGATTGRDGLGAATGSSKTQTAQSLTSAGAEVQKGDAPEERKILRLFANREAARLIKRCNDFGAGGASVAIGELCDGVTIHLDAIPPKAPGMNGYELGLSESQERMACVVAAADADAFVRLAREQNLSAVAVATVTQLPRLRMEFQGKTIVDIDRAFLNSSGAPKSAVIAVQPPQALPSGIAPRAGDLEQRYHALLSDLNVCSRRGMVQQFDSTVGTASLLAPLGGATRATPVQVMAARLPSENGDCETASLMAYGYAPALSEASPFHGGAWAVCQSLCRLIAAGGDLGTAYLSFQEFFEKPNNKISFGKPFAALLGAFEAQHGLSVSAIGGKDSMSGSFENIHVPPTLLSFAVCNVPARRVISPEFKRPGHVVTLLRPQIGGNGLPDFADLKRQLDRVSELCERGAVASAYAVGMGGVAEGLAKMAFGNNLGVSVDAAYLRQNDLFADVVGGLLLAGDDLPGERVGVVTEAAEIAADGVALQLDRLRAVWEAPLADVFPPQPSQGEVRQLPVHPAAERRAPAVKVAKPSAALLILPGTNGEVECVQQLTTAGAHCAPFVLKNASPAELAASVEALAGLLKKSQMLVLPHGQFGFLPNMAGRIAATLLKTPAVAQELAALLDRGGLVLGIGSGFDALLRANLLTGDLTGGDAVTLAPSPSGRHLDAVLPVRVLSTRSPWMAECKPGEQVSLPLSLCEGRLVAPEELLRALSDAGRIATQFAGADYLSGACGVESLTSADGRVLGRLTAAERISGRVLRNIPDAAELPLFAAGVRYFA